MNDKDLEKKIKEEMDKEIEESGESTPVSLLIGLGCLDRNAVSEWESRGISYLEKAIKLGPQKILRLMAVMSAHAKKEGYKVKVRSYTAKDGSPLRFSRTGNSVIEKQFSALYYDKYWSN